MAYFVFRQINFTERMVHYCLKGSILTVKVRLLREKTVS